MSLTWSFLEWILWCSTGMIVYVYIGYPAILWVVNQFTVKRRPREPEQLPTVTIVISAYNEVDCIRGTIENKLALDYPTEKCDVIVTSDGSSDGTDEIVNEFKPKGVRLIRQTPRQGKTAAINRMVADAKGEIVVFSDANSMYQEDALRRIVRNFSDGKVGYVTGRMVYVDKTRSIIGCGCTAYMRYENVLRRLESQFGSVIGVDGGIDAVRRCLYEPMPSDLLPDLVLPLRIIQQGHRVVFEGEALLQESTLTQTSDEWAMRVRVVLRSLHALYAMRALLNPLRFPRAAFQIWSHKVLRYLVGLFQIALVACNAALAWRSALYSTLMAAQMSFYLLAFLGSTNVGSRWVPGTRYAFYLCLLNAASLAAIFRFFGGERQVVWNPRRGKARGYGGE